MPRTAAQDTPAQRELKVMNSVSRRLDELDDAQQARVVDWIDGLVDGDPKKVEAEIKAMREVARQFQTLDARERESAVRWLNEKYGSAPDTDGNPDNGDGPHAIL